jgi:hypothetical protein
VKNFIKKHNIPAFNKSLKNITGERWLEIEGSEGHFMVSNRGRIKSVPRFVLREKTSVGFWTKEKIMSQCAVKSENRFTKDFTVGMMVTYAFDKKRFSVMVRRLVYEAFILPRTKEKMEENFIFNKDGNGLNNLPSNLGLCTWSDLRKHQLSNKRYIPPAFKVDPEKNRKHLLKMNRKKRKKISQYSPGGKLIKTFPSLTAASKKTGVSITGISACANKDIRQAKGFVWRFEPAFA